MAFDWLKNLFKKKEVPQVATPVPSVPEPKVELSKLSNEQRIEMISAQIDVMNERIKNIERMVEEIYKIAKS
jgi:hypothetical protein